VEAGGAEGTSRKVREVRNGKEYHLRSQLGSLGERRKLPQWGPGRAPATNAFWWIFSCRNVSDCHNFCY